MLTHCATEQLAAFTADQALFRALLDRHGSHPADADPEARPIEVRFFALPAPPPTPATDPHPHA